MTAERWAQLKTLFETALDKEASDRAEFLEGVGASDPQLRQDLECLLRDHARAGDFLTGLIPTDAQALRPGQVVAERFEIVELLGRGGMGEVYRAIDCALDQEVALKALNRFAAEGSVGEARLREEIRQARRVTHGNVCRLYDLGRHETPAGPVIFLTMELLVGETLAERLRRVGPFPEVEGRSVAAQMASALDAAHRAGVIHRDFKSANVMLSADGSFTRAVVLDFGLARAARREEREISLTATGNIIGTPAYMAPEQLRGGEATARSDVYAFGVVLNEIFYGRRQFHFGGRPVDAVIRRCLDPDPERRYATAGEAARDLAARPGARVLPRRTVFAASAAIVLLSLLAWVMRVFVRDGSIPAGSVIMIADFTNSTGDSSLNGVGVELKRQLAQSGHFDLWDDARRAPVLRAMGKSADEPLWKDVARQAALREGVPFVLSGGVAPLSEGLVINLQLEELEAHSIFRRRVWDHSVSASSRTGMYESLTAASRWLRRTVGETAADLVARDRLPQDTTTDSWEALSLYAQADTAQGARESERAISLLKQAVTRDPHFALGHMRLGDILLSIRNYPDGVRHWQLALDESRRPNLTLREELRIRGLYASELQDYAAAEAAFSQLEASYPHDYLAGFYLADALRWQGRVSEAATKFSALQRGHPYSAALASNYASALLLDGRFGDLQALLKTMEAHNDGDLAAFYRGLLSFASEDYPGAIAALQAASSSSSAERRSRGFSGLAAVLAELGRLRAAREALKRGIEADTQAGRTAARGDKLVMLAYLDLRSGDRRTARNLSLEAGAVDDNPRRIARSAVLLARAGFGAEARQQLSGLLTFPKSPLIDSARHRIEGELALAEHRPAAALQSFSAAAAVEPTLRLKDYLARGFLAAGESVKAVATLRRLAEWPALLWQTIDFDYPGTLTDSLLELAEAAERARNFELARRARELFARRRAGADPEVGQSFGSQTTGHD
jgi:hypothetical protein